MKKGMLEKKSEIDTRGKRKFMKAKEKTSEGTRNLLTYSENAWLHTLKLSTARKSYSGFNFFVLAVFTFWIPCILRPLIPSRIPMAAHWRNGWRL